MASAVISRKSLSPICGDEDVLVFPVASLKEDGYFHGIRYDYTRYLKTISHNSKFMMRSRAELDVNYKQIIPYAIFVYRDKVFAYRRGGGHREKRLHSLWSIGVGGHISKTVSSDFYQMYKESLERELREELVLEAAYESRLRAVLNDDSNEVGRVHFGLVHVFVLKDAKISGREKGTVNGRLVGINSLINEIRYFENWSKICIEEIFKLIS